MNGLFQHLSIHLQCKTSFKAEDFVFSMFEISTLEGLLFPKERNFFAFKQIGDELEPTPRVHGSSLN